jgi:predicted nucleic acid-binding protein
VAYAVLPGDRTDASLAVAARDPAWIAPALWRFELRNVLATAMRLKGLRLPAALAAFSAAEDLVADADLVPSTEACLRLAARGGVSAYDAEFVLVAERLGLPLVTADKKLAKAFPGLAVSSEAFARGA